MEDFIAGCCGGIHLELTSIGGTVIGHPADFIKVRQQIYPGALSAQKCLQLAIQQEGVLSVFKGMSSPLYTSALVNATFFGIYGNTVKFCLSCSSTKGPDLMPSYGLVTFAGVVAGTVQLAISSPVELIKIKLQTTDTSIRQKTKHGSTHANHVIHTSFKGPTDCLVALYKAHGIGGWYKGLVPMFWRDAPTYGLYMLIYEYLLRNGQQFVSPDGVLTEGLLTLIAGGITGTVTWIAAMPMDVVKSRIMADCTVHPKYQGTLHCIRVSYAAEGLQVFTRGIYMIALRAMVVNAATFFIYQNVLSRMSQQ